MRASRGRRPGRARGTSSLGTTRAAVCRYLRAAIRRHPAGFQGFSLPETGACKLLSMHMMLLNLINLADRFTQHEVFWFLTALTRWPLPCRIACCAADVPVRNGNRHRVRAGRSAHRSGVAQPGRPGRARLPPGRCDGRGRRGRNPRRAGRRAGVGACRARLCGRRQITLPDAWSHGGIISPLTSNHTS